MAVIIVKGAHHSTILDTFSSFNSMSIVFASSFSNFQEVYSNPADTSKPVLAASQSKEPYADSIYEPYRQQEASLYHVIQKLKKLSVKPLPHDQGFQK